MRALARRVRDGVLKRLPAARPREARAPIVGTELGAGMGTGTGTGAGAGAGAGADAGADAGAGAGAGTGAGAGAGCAGTNRQEEVGEHEE